MRDIEPKSRNDIQELRIQELRKRAKELGITDGLLDPLVNEAERAGESDGTGTESDTQTNATSTSSTSSSSPSDMDRKALIKVINDKRAELETAMNEYNTLMSNFKTKLSVTELDKLKNKVFKLTNKGTSEYFQINAYGYKRMFESGIKDHKDSTDSTKYATIPESCANPSTNKVIDLDVDANKELREHYEKLIKDNSLIKSSDAKIKSKTGGGQCGMESKIIFYNGEGKDTFAYITPGGLYRFFPEGTTEADLKSYSQCGDKTIEKMEFKDVKEDKDGDSDAIKEENQKNKTYNDELTNKFDALKSKLGSPFTSKETDSCQEVEEDDDPMVVKRELEEKINTLYDEIKELISDLGEKVDEVEKKAAEESESKGKEMVGNEAEIMKLKRELETDKEQTSYFEIFKRFLNVRLLILMLILLGLSTMVFYFLGTGTINFSKYFQKVKTETTDAIEDIREGAEDVVEDTGEAIVDTEKL